jgi:hypothetical protein
VLAVKSLRIVPPLALLLLGTANVNASESYPRTLEAALEMSCAPACTTCHTRPSGGQLTANSPVGISARRAGLECCDTALLLDVFEALEASGTDSDADGTPDVAEFRAGTDPNAPEGELECVPPPEDPRCTVSRVPSRTSGAWALGILGFLVLVWLRRLPRQVSLG